MATSMASSSALGSRAPRPLPGLAPLPQPWAGNVPLSENHVNATLWALWLASTAWSLWLLRLRLRQTRTSRSRGKRSSNTSSSRSARGRGRTASSIARNAGQIATSTLPGRPACLVVPSTPVLAGQVAPASPPQVPVPPARGLLDTPGSPFSSPLATNIPLFAASAASPLPFDQSSIGPANPGHAVYSAAVGPTQGASPLMLPAAYEAYLAHVHVWQALQGMAVGSQ